MADCDACGATFRFAWQAARCCDELSNSIETVD